jgi:peptidyl-tRNA hydrolase ICT1
VNAARKWLVELHEASLPSSIGEVSYSRSSGPGGQNVNKFVSSLVSARSF